MTKAASGDARSVGDLSFEDAEAELEEMNLRLAAGNVPLEEQLALHERAAALDAHCRSLLDSFEARLKQLEAQRGATQPTS